MTRSETLTSLAPAPVPPQTPTAMDAVMAAGHAVAAAHTQWLEASDALADAMHYNRNFVLLRVLPKRAAERRRPKKVLEFLKREYAAIEHHLNCVAQADAEAAARRELLARLKLSAAEIKLLGINLENL